MKPKERTDLLIGAFQVRDSINDGLTTATIVTDTSSQSSAPNLVSCALRSVLPASSATTRYFYVCLIELLLCAFGHSAKPSRQKSATMPPTDESVLFTTILRFRLPYQLHR